MNYITYKNTYSEKFDHIITKAVVYHNDIYVNTIALWDTGASHTFITEDIINIFNLIPIGEAHTLSHGGNIITKKYITTIELPSKIKINNIPVYATGNMHYKEYDIGVIVGMDIIQNGDFHIDYTGDKLTFTFKHWYSGNENLFIETEDF